MHTVQANKRTAILLLLLVLNGCWAVGSSPSPQRIDFPGARDNGLFDPSLAEDGRGRIRMSYSAVPENLP